MPCSAFCCQRTILAALENTDFIGAAAEVGDHWGGYWNNPGKRVSVDRIIIYKDVLISGTFDCITLPGKRDCTDVIKLRILSSQDYEGELNIVTWVLRREPEVSEGDETMEGEKGGENYLVYSWLWRRRKGPETKECRQPLEAGKDKEILSNRPSRRNQVLATHFILPTLEI